MLDQSGDIHLIGFDGRFFFIAANARSRLRRCTVTPNLSPDPIHQGAACHRRFLRPNLYDEVHDFGAELPSPLWTTLEMGTAPAKPFRACPGTGAGRTPDVSSRKQPPFGLRRALPSAPAATPGT